MVQERYNVGQEKGKKRVINLQIFRTGKWENERWKRGESGSDGEEVERTRRQQKESGSDDEEAHMTLVEWDVRTRETVREYVYGCSGMLRDG